MGDRKSETCSRVLIEISLFCREPRATGRELSVVSYQRSAFLKLVELNFFFVNTWQLFYGNRKPETGGPETGNCNGKDAVGF